MEEKNGARSYYYYFDCLDGLIGDNYFTFEEVEKLIKKKSSIEGPITEKHIKRVAANYEATLYRYEKDEEGHYINEVCLYDPFDCFG